MQASLSKILALQLSLMLLSACGSDRATDGGQAGASSSNSAAHAQLRFLYHADWQAHLAACAWISEYRLEFGAIPVPIHAPIDVTPDSLSEYVQVDGRTYKDSDVLHVFACSKSQTSKQTLELYGKFGADLPLEPAKRYTVTLGGTAATIAEDP